MKEIFRHRDLVIVSQYGQLLEAEGLQTFIRNEFLSATEVQISTFFPALCVVNEDEYEKAIIILGEYAEKMKEDVGEDIVCSGCEEMNPGNFEMCWNCGTELKVNE